MENQSYDRLLGYLEYPIGDLNENVYCNEFKGQNYCTRRGAKFVVEPDPSHGFDDVNSSIFGTDDFPAGNDMEETMSWFAHNQGIKHQSYTEASDAMDCHDPSEVPIITTLAKEFKTANRWFSPIPTCTDPNKYFYHTGGSKGNTANCDGWFCSGYPMKARTIYEDLRAEGYTTSLHWMDWNEAFAITPLNQDYSYFVYDQEFEKFYEKLEKGTLDNYTFLLPRQNWNEYPDFDKVDQNSEEFIRKAPNTQHPSEDIRGGEYVYKKIYENLRKSKYWESSVFLITYDEAGGFFDHVKPPKDAVNPHPESKIGPDDFEFKRYGVRTPAVIISPWLKKGTVDSKTYDHSAVPKTVRSIFDLKSEYLSDREKIMPSFISEEDLLDEPRKDCPMTLPDIPSFQKRPYQTAKHPQLEGNLKNQMHLLGTMMVKYGKLSKNKYKSILDKIGEQQWEAKIFVKELQQLLGYIPLQKQEFQYLSKNIQENM